MLLKGALHVHSTCSDGALPIAAVVRLHEEQGFDFIALTDHDYLLREGCYARQLASIRTDLLVFLGTELTVFEQGYVHVNQIRGVDEVLHVFNHPAELNQPVAEVALRIQRVALKLPLDAIEVTLNGFHTPEFDTSAIPYPKLATDDSHNKHGIGRAWIELDCPREQDAILRAIKRGESWNCFLTSSPR